MADTTPVVKVDTEDTVVPSKKVAKFVSFFINGQQYDVGSDGKFGPNSRLVDYIREVALLTGTKFMCREGGCGACLVMVKYTNASNKQLVTKSVNSCLVPLFSCEGWRIWTVESLGNKTVGYSKIQQQIVKYNASQCGYCTSGMIMNMNSLLEAGQTLRMKDIESLMDGNICRCTGYRPLIDAFKSLASDAPKVRGEEEEDASESCCRSCPGNCKGGSPAAPAPQPQPDENLRSENLPENALENEQRVDLPGIGTTPPPNNLISVTFNSGEEWVVVTTLNDAFSTIKRFRAANTNYRIVAGNTGTGIFKNDGPYTGYINISNIPVLGQTKIDASSITLGATVTITETVNFLKTVSISNTDGVGFIIAFCKHILRAANNSVRNAATLGGNLALKHNHPEFPSDVFLLLTTLNATVTVLTSPTRTEVVAVGDFLKYDLKDKLVYYITIPRWTDNLNVFRTFKISQRFHNSHAEVNAGFLMKVSQDNKYTVIGKPNIIYGGISPTFVHATKTETYLMGKSLSDPRTLKGAMDRLNSEIQPTEQPPNTSVEYRKMLAQSLLYKTILKIVYPVVSTKFKSGASRFVKGTTRAQQDFITDPSVAPINQPVHKIDAPLTTSGEAIYINDIPKQQGELFAAFVLSTIGNGEIDKMDATSALTVPGVQAYLTAKDVPGVNSVFIYAANEELFCSGKVLYNGQILGMILAETREAAFQAVKLVVVTYKNVQTPKLEPTLEPAPARMELDPDVRVYAGVRSVGRWNNENQVVKNYSRQLKGPPPLEEAKASDITVEGEFKLGYQYHYHIENQVALVVPQEDHFMVYSATQHPTGTQTMCAQALGVPSNNINVIIKRIGGSYGAKLTRASAFAALCTIAAKITNRPIRTLLDIETNMAAVGRRSPYTIKYKIIVNSTGKISKLDGVAYQDIGAVSDDLDFPLIDKSLQNCYDVTGWTLTVQVVNTDTTPNTFIRAPGTAQGIALVEHMMDHIAFMLGMDPLEVRKANYIRTGSPLLLPDTPDQVFEGKNILPDIYSQLQQTGNLDERFKNVQLFNQNNRWKKRGISIVPMKYYIEFFGTKFPMYVAVYKNDGTVVVTMGGVEMGQGINTKVTQTVAYMFKIPIETIRIAATDNIIGCNADYSAVSYTSELCCYAAIQACQTILDRIKPVRDKLREDNKKEPLWTEVITAAGSMPIDLTATHQYNADDPVKTYNVWGMTASEVEVDCLTGEYKVVRTDLYEDTGRSLNPEIDIGQIEGGFMMGLGWLTTENMILDPQTGALLNNNTYNYFPPAASDVPEDFRVTILRNSSNEFGVLRSKAVAEPPTCMAMSVFLALRHAVFAARAESSDTQYINIDTPLTQEKVLLNCKSEAEKFGL